MVQTKRTQSDSKQSATAGAPLWEWIIGGIGLIGLIALLGFFTYEAFQPNQPPAIVVQSGQILAQDGSYLVQVTALNQGDDGAAQVVVEGRLTPKGDPSGAPVETSTVTFDVLAPQSAQQGGLFFQADPQDYELTLRVHGYVEP